MFSIELLGNNFLGSFPSTGELPSTPDNYSYATVRNENTEKDEIWVFTDGNWRIFNFEGLGISDSGEDYSAIATGGILGFVPLNEGDVEYIVGPDESPTTATVTYKSIIENPPYQVDYKFKDGDWTDYQFPVVNMIKKEVGRLSNE